MEKRLELRRRGKATLAIATLMAGPVAVACSSGPTYEDWADTDGAAGRINLDEIQDAFKKSESATDFEDRVNQIYEGDGIILIRAKQEGEARIVEGWEDLNGSKEIDDGTDDLLFTIVRDSNNQHEMHGHGANGYYHSGFGTGNFFMTYMLISAMSPRGYYYNTSPARYNTINRNRANYRSSTRYRSQVSRNSTYFARQKNFAGSRYTQASRNTSAARNSYLNTQKSSGAFKSSGTGVRSSWGAGSRSGRSSVGRGGFRGGGGGVNVIGVIRPSQQ